MLWVCFAKKKLLSRSQIYNIVKSLTDSTSHLIHGNIDLRLLLKQWYIMLELWQYVFFPNHGEKATYSCAMAVYCNCQNNYILLNFTEGYYYKHSIIYHQYELSRSLWWGAVIYYVWSQAASSTSTPVNDFLHRPEWLGTTVAMNLIHSAAGYMCRWRRRNSEGGGQVPPVEKKWVMSITQNTACLVAELLPCLLRKTQMKKRYFCLLWWMLPCAFFQRSVLK